jgi:maltose alpha-D-glucosyltransferase / alpha-amylase
MWYRDAVVYQTHVKCFFDATNDGIGDFRGLTQKLDYLQSLGVNCIALEPFFPSPLRNDGYDIADYNDIHPSYGNRNLFGAFTAAARERGLRVIIELVINHTSERHPWFQAARKAPPGSSKRDFYMWSDTDRKYAGVPVLLEGREHSNWAWDSQAQAYYWHRFTSSEPDLDFDNPAVLAEITSALRFWLGAGVDGIRMPFLTYLMEREGTSCEDLPESHERIRAIRHALNERHPGGVLISDDARFLGRGDECHMAFTPPLAPLLAAALAREDASGLIAALTCTAELPPQSQWALRLHDSRRLAPLMENDRRRMELALSLLFSLPGSPVLFYGDEIGMGDNVYLGPRNAIRTPMQWSADRNAGFSRANPAQLYSPLIIGPVYGYEAVNVEAQQSDPASLLNWVRTLIEARSQSAVFGRGTCEWLNANNGKVLAYRRTLEEDQVLCLANLSRNAQPVELDLSELAGMTPVEMLGRTDFPAIEKGPYRATLAPHAFLWFQLHGRPEATRIGAAPSASAESPCPIVLQTKAEELLAPPARKILEDTLLGEFLPRQRWFGAKSRTIKSTHIVDAAWIEPMAFLIIEVRYVGGGEEWYNVPLTISDAAPNLRQDAVVCEVEIAGRRAVLHDAMWNDDACRLLLATIEQNRALGTTSGILSGTATGAFAEIGGAGGAVKRSSAEQSNTSVIFGGRLIMKLFRKLEEGPNPDFEIGRFLTEHAHFDAIPRLAGGIEYRRNGRETSTAAMVQQMIPNQGDGWKMALDELARYYERVPDAKPPADDSDRGVVEPYLQTAATLGRRTAQMHAALSTQSEDPAFHAEPMDAADSAKLAAAFREHARSVFEVLKHSIAHMADEFVDQAAQTLGQRKRLLDRFSTLDRLHASAVRIRIHGDYHLGQVLAVEDDFVILDFEGEPARPLSERRAKQLAVKDVAGMLRSLSYAAFASLFAKAGAAGPEYERLEPWAGFWQRCTSAAFLHAYREESAGAEFVPAGDEDFQTLLNAFLLDKALYELKYELNNRPGWVRIPIGGILSLAS